MRDMSLNLPTWAWQLGYRLEGDLGTVGDLFMSKDGKPVRAWRHPAKVPDIFELEEIIRKEELNIFAGW